MPYPGGKPPGTSCRDINFFPGFFRGAEGDLQCGYNWRSLNRMTLHSGVVLQRWRIRAFPVMTLVRISVVEGISESTDTVKGSFAWQWTHVIELQGLTLTTAPMPLCSSSLRRRSRPSCLRSPPCPTSRCRRPSRTWSSRRRPSPTLRAERSPWARGSKFESCFG